jgi:hypothetical protein
LSRTGLLVRHHSWTAKVLDKAFADLLAGRMQGPLPTQVFVECQAVGCASVLQVRHAQFGGLPVAVGVAAGVLCDSFCVPLGNLVQVVVPSTHRQGDGAVLVRCGKCNK